MKTRSLILINSIKLNIIMAQFLKRTEKNGSLTDNFTAVFRKPPAIGGLIDCKILKKNREEILHKHFSLMLDMPESKALENAKKTYVRLVKNSKAIVKRLRVLSYEWDTANEKYIAVLTENTLPYYRKKNVEINVQ